MSTLTITEFLKARIAEDEYDANRELLWGTTQTLTRMNARIIDECAAKRAILAKTPRNGDFYDPGSYTSAHTVRALAAVYADHADYQEGWAL